MALTAANNTAQITITSTDINGNTSVNRGAGNPTLNGVFSDLTINANFAVGTTALPIPGGTGIAYNLYFKNNASPGSGITFQLAGTLTGGASQIIGLLQPGGVILIWQVVNNVTGSGYSAFSVTVVGGVCPVEFFIGA